METSRLVLSNSEFILSNLPDDKTLGLYIQYHDVGKPFCIEIEFRRQKTFSKPC
jgi:hypothetical protein